MNAAGGHLSAAQIAQLGLPDLPGSKRGVLFRADKEGWRWIEQRVRGGSVRLFDVTTLPMAAQDALAQRQAPPTPANLRSVGRPKGSDFFTRHPDVADAVEAYIAELPRSANTLLALLSTRFAKLPSRRSLSRFVSRIEEEKKALLMAMRNPDGYRNQYRVSLGRADGAITHANQVWELDTTPADILTKGGRKAILGVIDVYSRRARFLVAESESGQSVRRLLTETIRAWGVMPEAVMTDNGSGYINRSIVTALETLGIEHRRCAPGSPEKKPHIERLFGTFTRQRAELLAGYSGHNVAQAQALRAREKKRTGRAVIVPEMEPAELQAVLDAWVEGVYNQREHGGIKSTPFQRWRTSPVASTRAPSEDTLKIALSKAEGTAIVGKLGIRWKSGKYWSAALPTWMGRMVQIRRDEDDLGALYVFDEDGHFIDTVVNHERAGFSEEQFARAARLHQNAFMKAGKAELREKMRRFSPEEARDALLRDDAIRAGQLTLFPAPTVERTTAQLDSIGPRSTPALPSSARLADAMARTERPKPQQLSVEDRVAAADRVLAAAAAGEAVDPTELAQARTFAGSSLYRGEKMITGHFPGPQDRSLPNIRRQSA